MSCAYRQLNMLSGNRKDMRVKRKKGDRKRRGRRLWINICLEATLKLLEHVMKGFLIFLSFQVFFCRSDIIQVVPNNENGTVDVRGTVVGETILKVSLALSKNGNRILKYCNVFSTLKNSEGDFVLR